MTRAAAGSVRDAADSAYRAAADAFLALDEAELSAWEAADALVALEPRREAAIRADVDSSCRSANAAVVDWITAVDTHQTAIRDPQANHAALAAAARDFTTVRASLERATPMARRYRERNEDAVSRLAAVAGKRDVAARAAFVAVDEASAAVERARAAGLAPAELDVALGTVRDQVAAAGAAGIGPAAVSAWGAAETAAREVVGAAERAERVRTDLPKRVRSLATRAAGIEGRAESLPDKLSNLRRSYSLACSAGLERAGDDVAGALTTGRRALATAETAMGADDWARATREVDTARSSLDDAEKVLSAVADRLRMLDEVRADPKGRLDKARFTLRDAQRLVVATGPRVATEIPTLDALAGRLDRAPQLLDATHPDYWSYLQELDAVTRDAQATVTRVRERIATG
ncbi:hypothetical protein [Pseudonocardia sp. N23]|uniref:hypothetical protein n=1 Tax=Pseudonocardia sp. N23 TaxID=1987376 RepID=UPI000C03519E|nr:hypothetical protein [Pseudonocardia sp. N23]GAY08830.1 hypothetical protein TOK_2786 [Pseudonocardia sp. N23]